MKRTTTHEPDLLPVFRAFSILWLGLMALILLSVTLVNRNPENEQVRAWIHVFSAVILVAYLYAPRLQEKLGRLYLPIALGIATVGPLAGLHLPLANAPVSEIGMAYIVLLSMRMVLIWLVVVVMLGWAYNARAVWIYSISIVFINVFIPWRTDNIPNDSLLDFVIFNFFIVAAFMLVGFLVARLSAAERAQRQEFVAANAQLVQYANTLENLTISRERNRMARELHDTLAHTLSGLAVQLETTKAFMDSDAETAKSLLEQSLSATRSGLQETRHALKALRATPLEDLGLRMALIQLGETAVQRTGAKLELDITENIPPLSPAIEQTIYRTAQEAIANVVKHATAQALMLKLTVNDAITLVVADDGVGFDTSNISEDGHYGLIGMQERTALVNGNITVTSQPGKGTQIKLTIESEN